MRQRRPGPRRELPRDWRLLDEFDAFLGGVYVEWAIEHAAVVPHWAWVNALAHGTIDDLEARASDTSRRSRRPADSWYHVLAFLAEQVLARAQHDPEQLRDLQRDVLVPLELHAAGCWLVPSSPGQVGSLVLRALEGARGRERREGS